MKWQVRLGLRILLWIAVYLIGKDIDPDLKTDMENIRTSLNVTGKDFLKDE